MEQQTIIAQCTPRGSGALALLRLSGAQAVDIATSLGALASHLSIKEVQSHTIHFGSIINDHDESIDQVMFLVMHAPRTFTGEDTVEITCHNNQFIIEAIIEQAIKHGARLAQEGEFCKRAVLNSKIDILQAEAIDELIHANTQLALKQSLAQVKGTFSQWIAQIEQELIHAMAYCHASFEFIDEENMTFGNDIKSIINNILHTIAELKITFDQQQRIRQGIRIALIGSVNAGKSSLFNQLLKQNRSIVTNIAGTTRDVIEAGIYKDQNYWTLIDTAGLRTTDDIIEKEGIERSLKEATLADIILLIVDASRLMHEHESQIINNIVADYKDKIIVIYNKNDLPKQTNFTQNGLSITTSNGNSIAVVEQAIEAKVATLCNALSSPFLLNKRHYTLLIALEQKCHEILPMLDDNPAYELISIHLQEAAAQLSELTGKTMSEAAMDQVFRSFCVGK